ncbi:MAG: Rnase Y domain-containing protein, partial [Lachnospiraceae bacterium]|nr:Rnase Y domain-containing protein [Lachnospiraceae bacterium]
MVGIIIAVLVTLVVAAPLSAILATNLHEQKIRRVIGDANAKAKEITDKASKAADELKREKLLEVKEESIKQRNELEKESKERRAEI